MLRALWSPVINETRPTSIYCFCKRFILLRHIKLAFVRLRTVKDIKVLKLNLVVVQPQTFLHISTRLFGTLF